MGLGRLGSWAGNSSVIYFWRFQPPTPAQRIRLFGLPGDRVVAALRKYNRMK